MKIAVVADVHLHDLYGGFGIVEEDSGELALRTFSDTMASTRVFNESYAAFLAVLDDIARRGIRDVVLLGDYSDDGQPGAVAALKTILSSYKSKHHLRFFATFGNHDCYGPAGRHQSKRLTKADDLEALVVTSDDAEPAPSIIRPEMRGMSTREAMQAMSQYGIERPSDVFHWETPFGAREGLAERYPEGGNPACLDASYLVEPQQGLWLLILDANVFDPIDGGWQVRSIAAWDHVLAHRPYLLPWIGDVARRADCLKKTLLAFSHYPALPLTLTGEGGVTRPVGTPDWLMRMPSLETARRLAAQGMKWHFSGHMHVAGRSELDGLVNVAVPSPVAYPGGYVIVEVEDGVASVETVSCVETPGFNLAFAAYERQAGSAGAPDGRPLVSCTTYHDFLKAHLRQLVARKHVPSDWPAALADHLDRPIGEFLRHAVLDQLNERWREAVLSPLRSMIEDYYLLRADGGDGRGVLTDRMGLYRDIKATVADLENPVEKFSNQGSSLKFLVDFCQLSLFQGSRT